MSFFTNNVGPPSDAPSPYWLVDLTGPEFKRPDGSTNVHVYLHNSGLADGLLFAVQPDGQPFPGNQGYFVLKPGQSIEMNLNFPLILKVISGGTQSQFYPLPSNAAPSVSVLAYRT